MGGQRPDARRHGRARLLDHHESPGLGGVGPRRRLLRPDGRLPCDQGALPSRPDVRVRLRLPGGQPQGRADRGLAGRTGRFSRGGRRIGGEARRQAGQAVRHADGRADGHPLPAALAGRPRESHRAGDRRARHSDRAPGLQPDVQDVRRRARERVERRLSPARDGAGDLRQLQERRGHRAGEAAVRHRADRQELPQRDQPA